MAYVNGSSTVVVGAGTGAGAVGATSSATVNDTDSDVSLGLNFLQNPSLAGAASLYGEDIFPFRNELDQFASYSPIFTFGCLTNIEYNFPLSYRALGPAVKIIKSGGGGGPTIPSLYDLDGKREFFIEDVNIVNTVAPNPDTRHTNLHSITFKVIEPYSMGQFFHNLRTASLVTGHKNYQDCPYLLSIAFIGYDDEGNVKSPFFSQRHFPIQLIQVEMDVTESGAIYTVTASPYSDRAVQDRVQRTKTDITCTGESVAEILQNGARSLTLEMNKLSEEQENTFQVAKADRYIIQFPNTNIIGTASSLLGSLTSTLRTSVFGLQELYQSLVGRQDGPIAPNVAARLAENDSVITTGSFVGDAILARARAEINEIGRSSLLKPGTTYNTGQTAYQIPGFVETEPGSGIFNRGNISYDYAANSYTFERGTKVTDIIEEVILTSQYGRDFANANPGLDGRKPWFRIEPQTYNAAGLLGGLIRGESAKVYVYRVVPYRVDESTTAGPTQSSLLSKAIKQVFAAKSFSYLYTGNNPDIIDFDLKFNLAFYTGVEAARSQRNLASVLGGQLGIIGGERQPVFSSGGNIVSSVSASGAAPVRDEANPATSGANGGNNRDDPEVGTARYFNDMVINTGNDMIQLDLKIHGDPYFIADSNLGNYVGLPTIPFSPVNLDGSMNPIDGEVHVICNFRTPIDYDEKDGYVKYPLGGFLPIAMFSGLYQVIKVNNEFKDGKFIQTLRLARKRNQDLTLEALAGSVISSIFGGGSNVINPTLALNMTPPTTDNESIA